VAPSGDSVEVAAADDPMVCKRIATTGTKITRKTCRRQSEIEQTQRNARDAVDTIQRKAAGQTTWTSDPANP